MSTADAIAAMLDAFVAAKYRNASLGLHENSEFPQLAETIAAWCKQHSIAIAHYVTTAHHRTYEVWNISIGNGSTVNVWPMKIGTLDGKDALANRIEEIRAAADRRIEALLNAEQAVQP